MSSIRCFKIILLGIFLLTTQVSFSQKDTLVMKSNEKVMDFVLDIKDLEKIKKMSGLLKDLSDLVITTDNGEIQLKVTSKEKSSNNFSLNMDGTITEEITMNLVMDIVNKLPASAFNVSIFKSKKGSLVSVFDSINVEGLSIVIAAKAE